MQISVIIVNHNTADVLKQCVDSVFKYENKEKFEIIIVDNASKDNSKSVTEKLCSEHSNIRAIFLNELKSFSYANNRGIESAKYDFILIMNPDIIFTEPVFDKLMMRIETDKTIGAITPSLIGTDGNFQRGYFQRYPSLRQFIYYYTILAKFFNRSAKRMNRYFENQDIDVSTGKLFFTEQIPCAFFMTAKNRLFETGLMDEKFILFFEDVDLSYRLNKSHKLAVDTSMQVIHLGGSSFKTEENWWLHGRFIKSMVYFFEKHYSPARTFLLKIMIRLNSYTILLIEGLKSVIGRKDNYRVKKHRHLLKLLKEN